MGILTWGDQGRVTEGAPRAALHDLRFVFCQCKCACTVGMFAVQSGCVLICLAGWPDGVLGRDLYRLITWEYVGGRTPHRCPEQLATPFFLGYRKKYGHWC